MRDAIILSDRAMDTANKLREMFNRVGVMQGETSFANLKEEEIIAACVFFMDMTLRNPMTLMLPHVLGTMQAALMVAAGSPDVHTLLGWANDIIERHQSDPELGDVDALKRKIDDILKSHQDDDDGPEE